MVVGIDPNFKQNISLGITGTIGDKLNVNVNWDTERTFDFQNQLKLEYVGYEDEIIQRIEAGNVFLQTPSTLINGGQQLFGIKSEFQLGGVRLTTVMSQQDSEANELSIEGGSQTREFEIKPTDYEDNSHFFISYFFRNTWEESLSDPTLGVITFVQKITDVEVWRLQQTTIEQDDERQVIALVDLGEGSGVLSDPNAGTDLPNSCFTPIYRCRSRTLKDRKQYREHFDD